ECLKLAIATTEQQTYSIASGLGDATGIRPNTHDLMKDTFELYSIEVLMVKVDDFRDGTYYAKLLLRQGNKILNLDSRPSDAIAVAVRFQKPVYVKNGIMESLGVGIC
ncbi:MAG: hypothetical protein GTN76_00795, partial [Candidatus Aenigmarchaeota archaeon]|nr:hypothetical protein [Candidatus Aenigmarchaeota archaeon]